MILESPAVSLRALLNTTCKIVVVNLDADSFEGIQVAKLKDVESSDIHVLLVDHDEFLGEAPIRSLWLIRVGYGMARNAKLSCGRAAYFREVEVPAYGDGQVLIEVEFSCLSPGTELSGVKSGRESLLARAKNIPTK